MTRDLDRFRRLCGQYRWLAVFMVASVGLLLIAANLIAPIVLWARVPTLVSGRAVAASLIWIAPALCYLFGVWSIGGGMGQLARGRLIQPTLAATLRRVGLALGFGGVISVFVVTNLLRLIGSTQGGYLHFDVAGMTLGMIGGAVFLLGRVVDQAGVVQAELDEMI
ncbi:DUF2975 domain-containing protein [Brevundimonas sp. NPDC046655]|uniref:DUF2975 domain-containing protein n=1 Tax=unclassified Brevundimonas TaxID=2622653 RepID=UPI00384D19B2